MTQHTPLSGIVCGSKDPPLSATPLNLNIVSHCLFVLGDNQRRGIDEIAEIFKLDKDTRQLHGNILVKEQKEAEKRSQDKQDTDPQDDTETGDGDQSDSTGEGGQSGTTGGNGTPPGTTDGKDGDGSKKKRADSLFNINKGLCLEKLVAYFMYLSDSPEYSRSHCIMHQASGLPCNFAPPGMSDGLVDYGDYQVCVEVTAKSSMSQEDYKTQLENGLEHMKKTASHTLLVVSEWGPETAKAREVLEGFKKRHEQELETVDFIPVSINTLHSIGSWLCADFKFKSQQKPVTGDDMKAVFRALTDAAFQFEEEEGKKKESQAEVWSKALVEGWKNSKKKPAPEDPSQKPS